MYFKHCTKQLSLATLLMVFVACGPTAEQIAREKFERANRLYGQEEFNDAKVVLDSLIEHTPKEIEYVTRANDLLRNIKIGEQERNLLFFDSALVKKEEELKVLMKNFSLSDEYGTTKILIHNRQKPVNAYGRSYLRAHLDTEGDFYISSCYVGEKYINHSKIKVYNDGQSILSEEVVEDGLNNRKFEDQGTFWEVVKYKKGADNGIVDFIAQNVNKPLKVHFIGKGNSYIVMERFDKEAISDGYEISFVLKDMAKIKKEITNVRHELDRLK